MAEDAMRAMHQQFANTELQNELTASSERACSTQTGSPRCSTAWDAGDGSRCDTRLLGKPSDCSRAQDAWRDWSAVFKGYAGAAIPRLQKLMDDAAKAAAPIPNATIL